MSQMEFYAPEETARGNPAPFRSGTSYGYAHVPVEIIKMDLSPTTLATYLSLVVANAIGSTAEAPELSLAIKTTKSSYDASMEELEAKGIVFRDGEDVEILEPEFWDK